MRRPNRRQCPSLKWMLIAVSPILSGCINPSEKDLQQYDPPQVALVSETNARLRKIPPPKHRVAVAVYDFRDLTGQYQEAENFQQLSNAVTQGGAPILIKALQDAGNRQWFKVLERNQLPDLLKERQIVTEMRRLYRGEEDINPAVLPPLEHASILIEGGIVGYNTNLRTGGVGGRYLGIGADTKYARDEITVALRAVSTKTGEVLHSVTARKSVMSVLLQSGVFRYVKLNALLEAEAGVADNEPRQIAVEAAIEKAVEALIVEGAALEIWAFKDPAAGRAFVQAANADEWAALTTAAAARTDTRHPAQIAATVPIQRRADPAQPEITEHRRPTPPPRQPHEDPVG